MTFPISHKTACCPLSLKRLLCAAVFCSTLTCVIERHAYGDSHDSERKCSADLQNVDDQTRREVKASEEAKRLQTKVDMHETISKVALFLANDSGLCDADSVVGGIAKTLGLEVARADLQRCADAQARYAVEASQALDKSLATNAAEPATPAAEKLLAKSDSGIVRKPNAEK